MKTYFILLIARAILQVNSIFRGVAVKPEQRNAFKHQVRLISPWKIDQWKRCSGALIQPNLVLTTAYCLVDAKSTTLIFGLYDENDTTNTVRRTVLPTDMKIHPGYDSASMKNDIALIKLQSSIPLSATIGPIALPPKIACSSYAGKDAVISGWGAINDSGATPSLLNYANVLVANPTDCSRLFTYFDSNSMVCGDASVAGPCQGDNGGPFTTNLNGKAVVIGCVSFGAVGCENTFDRVMTCVSNYIDWINANR